MDLEIFSRWFTFLVFGAAGYLLSDRFKPPQRPLVWLACLAGILLVGFIGVHTRLIDLFGFTLYFNNFLQGLGSGLLLGLLLRHRHNENRHISI